MPFEGLPVTKVTRSDNESETLAVSESALKKPVDPVPAAPIGRRWPIKMRRKRTEFKHELAEDRGSDGRNRPREQLERKEGELKEHHTKSQAAENRELCEFEIVQLEVSYQRKVSQSSGDNQRELARTGLMGYDSEVFKGICACVQRMLSATPEEALELNRSKVNPVWNFMDKVHRPLNHSINTSQPEVPT